VTGVVTVIPIVVHLGAAGLAVDEPAIVMRRGRLRERAGDGDGAGGDESEGSNGLFHLENLRVTFVMHAWPRGPRGMSWDRSFDRYRTVRWVAEQIIPEPCGSLLSWR